LCTPAQGDTQRISLHIEPPDHRAELVAQQVLDVPVRSGEPLPDFQMRRPIRLTGLLTLAGLARTVGADLRFRALDGIPGRRLSTSATAGRDRGEFQTLLAPGRYEITIRPDFPGLPLEVLPDVRVDDDGINGCEDDRGSFCLLWSWALIPPEEHVLLRGQVQTVERDEVRPLAGVEVQAWSSDGTSQAPPVAVDDSGRFVLLLSPGVPSWKLRVTRETGSVRTEWEFGPWVPLEDPDPAEVILQVGELTESLSLQGQLLVPEAGASVQGGVVVLDGQLPGRRGDGDEVPLMQGRIQTWLSGSELDADGRFTVRLPAGPYTAWALAAGPPLRMAPPLIFRLQSENQPPIRMALESAVPWQGRVVVPARGDEPVPGAQVRGRLVRAFARPVDLYGPGAALCTVSLTTDTEGMLSAPLPTGEWEWEVSPPATLGLADTVLRTVVRPDPGLVTPLAVREAALLSGRLLDPAARPLAGARMEAWQVEPDGSRRLGWGMTMSDGTWQIRIPAER
jgi:hypothetical protein